MKMSAVTIRKTPRPEKGKSGVMDCPRAPQVSPCCATCFGKGHTHMRHCHERKSMTQQWRPSHLVLTPHAQDLHPRPNHGGARTSILSSTVANSEMDDGGSRQETVQLMPPYGTKYGIRYLHGHSDHAAVVCCDASGCWSGCRQGVGTRYCANL